MEGGKEFVFIFHGEVEVKLISIVVELLFSAPETQIQS